MFIWQKACQTSLFYPKKNAAMRARSPPVKKKNLAGVLLYDFYKPQFSLPGGCPFL